MASTFFLAQCLSLLFTLQTLEVTTLHIPSFSTTHLAAHFYNLSCANVTMSAGNYVYSADTVKVDSPLPTRLKCRTNLDWQAYRGVFELDTTVASNVVQIDLVNDHYCNATQAQITQCALHMKVNQMQVTPPNPALDLMLPQLQHAMEATAERYMCNVSAPRLATVLTNSTLPSPTPPPPMQRGARAVSTTSLFIAMRNIVSALTSSRYYHPELTFINDTVIRLTVHVDKGWLLTTRWLTNSTEKCRAPCVSLPDDADETCASLPQDGDLECMLRAVIEPAIKMQTIKFEGQLEANLVAGMHMAVDIAFDDLRCNDVEGYICTVPRQNGIQVLNLRATGAGTMNRLISKEVAPTFITLTNHVINTLTNTTSRTTHSRAGEDRYIIPMRPKARRYEGPAVWVLVSFIIIALLHLVAIIRYDIKCYAEQPWVYRANGAIVPMRRILLEDGFLCTCIFVCMGCFLWSNTANAATVVVGNKLEVYTFSLLSTARDLYGAGLWPLALFVILFSGIYPYFKLYTILVYTTVMHRPRAKALEFIDVLGKYSFLDAFVMIIMVSGLQINHIVDVRIETAYYMFLFSTVASILIGNYATMLWHRGVHRRGNEQEPENDSQNSACLQSYDRGSITETFIARHEEEDTLGIPSAAAKLELKRCKGILFYTVVVMLTLPAWILPAIDFNVEGLVSAITKSKKSMTLLQLNTESGLVNTAVAVVTTVIAPILQAMYHKKYPFIASWCATDVLLLACAASVLQLKQFTEFIAGKEMHPYYAAHVVLQIPIYLLIPSATLTWFTTIHTWLQKRKEE